MSIYNVSLNETIEQEYNYQKQVQTAYCKRFRENGEKLDSEMVLISTKYNMKIIVYKKADFVSDSIRIYGIWEEEISN